MKNIIALACLSLGAATAHAYDLREWRIEGTIDDVIPLNQGFTPLYSFSAGQSFSFIIRINVDVTPFRGMGYYDYDFGAIQSMVLSIPEAGYRSPQFEERGFDISAVNLTTDQGGVIVNGFRLPNAIAGNARFALTPLFSFSNPTDTLKAIRPYDDLHLLDQSFNLNDLKVEQSSFGPGECVIDEYWCGTLNMRVTSLSSTAVPEPSIIWMALAGVAAAGSWTTRRRTRARGA